MRNGRIVVGLSGGVDSAVAALLLKQQGHDVLGIFMKNWEDDDDDEYCSSRTDLVDAVAVADSIGIDIEVVNFSAEYKERVFSEFLSEYRAGRTPNPDVLCNSEIKFRCFLDHAVNMGAERIATGHYARIRQGIDGAELLRGLDPNKDQSYFLHRLNPGQLSRTMFPVGAIEKPVVRRIAREHGLAVHGKRDSTGICFIGERPFREFLNRYLPTEPGAICTPEGETVGRHMGLMYYTIGQRQGLGIGGRATGDGTPWYVAGKDQPSNRLIVVQGHDHPMLLSRVITATRASWTGKPPRIGHPYTIKTRYRQTDTPCTISAMHNDRFTITCDVPQWAATPGQSAVLYDGDACIGGGIIDAVGDESPAPMASRQYPFGAHP